MNIVQQHTIDFTVNALKQVNNITTADIINMLQNMNHDDFKSLLEIESEWNSVLFTDEDKDVDEIKHLYDDFIVDQRRINKTRPRYDHVVLYAKGHYHMSDDIIEDLKKCLTADGYSGHLMTTENIISVFTELYEKLPFNGHSRLLDLISSLHPRNCWKIGYWTKYCQWADPDFRNNYPDYDYYKAVIYYVLHELKFKMMIEINPVYRVISIVPDPNVLPLANIKNE